MSTLDELRKALNELENEYNRVGRSCLPPGTHNSQRCPVANALKSKGIDGPSVTRTRTRIPFSKAAGGWASVPNPPGLQAFVVRFDLGAYPELEF